MVKCVVCGKELTYWSMMKFEGSPVCSNKCYFDAHAGLFKVLSIIFLFLGLIVGLVIGLVIGLSGDPIGEVLALSISLGFGPLILISLPAGIMSKLGYRNRKERLEEKSLAEKEKT